jgi:hypothetical protein
MTFMPVNGSQQCADCRRLRDSRSMFDSWGSERTLEIGGWITFSAVSRDGVSEDLTACAAEATSRFVASSRFNPTQYVQEFRVTDVGNGSRLCENAVNDMILL